MRKLGHDALVLAATLLLAACGSSEAGGSAGGTGGAVTQGGGVGAGGRAGSAANVGGGATSGAATTGGGAGRGGVESAGGRDDAADAGSNGSEAGADTGNAPLPAELEWTLVADTAGQTWEGIWGSSPDDIYVVGRLGDLVHFSAGKWALEVTGTGSTLTGVWGSGPTDVYVSVYSNLILHSTGDGVWTHDTLDAGLTFEQVWGLDADTVFALGRGVYRRNGAADWSLEAGSYSGVDLWGSALTNRYVVGPAGGETTVVHSTGAGKWSGQPGPDQSLYAVFGSSANAVFVGGVGGVFFSTGDGTWRPQLVLDPTAGNPINAIWAAGPAAVFACSEGGFVYRSNGAGRWSEGTAINGAGPVRNCNAIWGTAENDVYVATVNGVFHGTLP